MTSKEEYRKIFNNLIDFEVYPNTESYEYNCISYTVGIYNEVSWPVGYWLESGYWPVKRSLTKESFDLFYEYHGFTKCSLDFSHDPDYIKVALYMNNNIPTHASIQLDYDWWESKPGSLDIIKHDLFQIEDDTYGKLSQIYKKRKISNTNEKILSFDDYKNI